jgi:hypothetical protein
MSIIHDTPYFSKFDPDKDYLQVLNKPEDIILTHELIEAQAILEDQIARFGKHMFANGSIVTGGAPRADAIVWIKIEDDPSQFLNTKIEAANGATGDVIAVDVDSNVIFIKQLDSVEDEFEAGSEIHVVNDSSISSRIVDTNLFSGQTFRFVTRPSVYFINGHFVKIGHQEIIPKPTAPVLNGLVGFEYEEKIITAEDDGDLYEPVLTSSTLGRAGADRLKIVANLVFIEDGSEPSKTFVEIMRIKDGVIKERDVDPEYARFGDILAQRTYDESGSYTVRAFIADVKDHVGVAIKEIKPSDKDVSHVVSVECYSNHGFIDGDIVVINGVVPETYNGECTIKRVVDDVTFEIEYDSPVAEVENVSKGRVARHDYLTIQMSPGLAYVRGYRHETIAPINVDLRRALDTKIDNNASVYVEFGEFVVVENVTGIFDPTTFSSIDLQNSNSDVIGHAKVRSFEFYEGSKYKLYLFDFELTGSETIANVRSIHDPVSGASASLSSDSIRNGKAFISGKSISSAFPLIHGSIKTFEPFNVPSISYVKKQVFNVSAGPSGIQLDLGIDNKFYGPIGIDFHDSGTANRHYIFDNGAGSILNPTSMTISSDGRHLNVEFGGYQGPVNALVSVHVYNAQSVNKKIRTKTYTFNNTAGKLRYELDVADIYRVVKIEDSNHNDLKDFFLLETGNRLLTLDHGAITLKDNSSIPSIPIGSEFTCVIEYFDRGEMVGPVTIDSFTEIDRRTLGKHITNTIDFRLIKRPAGSNYVGDVLAQGTEVLFDYEYYLPRRDVLTIGADGNFKVIEGEPKERPEYPEYNDNDGLILYNIDIRPYTGLPEDVNMNLINRRRYTMRDIGKLEKRVNRLEYYTNLTMLETKALREDVVDSNGLTRFKTGMFVDIFDKPSARSIDHISAVDPKKRELRPAFKTRNFKLNYISGKSSLVKEVGDEKTGMFLTLPFEETEWIKVFAPASFESVNPFLITTKRGEMQCQPPFDDWKDEERVPDRRVDVGDQYRQMVNVFNEEGLLGTTYGEWQDGWSGVAQMESSAQARPIDSRIAEINNSDRRFETVINQSSVGQAVSSSATRDIQILPPAQECNNDTIRVMIRYPRVASLAWNMIPYDRDTNRLINNDYIPAPLTREEWDEIFNLLRSWLLLTIPRGWHDNYQRAHKIGDKTINVKSTGRDNSNGYFFELTTECPAPEIIPAPVIETESLPSEITILTNVASLNPTNHPIIWINEQLGDFVDDTLKKLLAGESSPFKVYTVYGREVSADEFVLDGSKPEFMTDAVWTSLISDITAHARTVTNSNSPQHFNKEFKRFTTEKYNATVYSWHRIITSDPTSMGYKILFEHKQTVSRPIPTPIPEPLPSPPVITGQHREVIHETLESSYREIDAGDRVVDMTIAHWIREQDIRVFCNGLLPNTELFIFVDDEPMSDEFTPDAGFESVSGGCGKSDDRGDFVGTLHIPAGKFRTGERKIRVTDSPTGSSDDEKTSAFYIFAASGLQLKKENLIISTRDVQYTHRVEYENRRLPAPPAPPPVIEPPEPPEPQPQPKPKPWWKYIIQDPLAQTFMVDKSKAGGVFLTSVDLFFKAKSETEPVWIEIRPVENGFPSVKTRLPMSRVYKYPDEINIPERIDDVAKIQEAATRFEFPVPIYLKPDTEYALIVQAATPAHFIYISKTGKTIYGTNQKIMAQPFLGSMFRSQNNRAWTPAQDEDICFVMNIAEFDVSASPVVVMENAQIEKDIKFNLFNHTLGAINIDGFTNIDVAYNATDRATLKQATKLTTYDLQTDVDQPFERIVRSGERDFIVKATLTTNDKFVAPLVDLSRNSVIAVHNQINNYQLENKFAIVDGGSGYDPNNPPTITITDPAGNGYGAKATPVIENGEVVDVVLSNPGYGFESQPSISIDGSAIINYVGRFESDPYFGNAKARYITPSIKLVDDMQTDRIDIRFDANRPNGTNVDLFIRVKAIDDDRDISNIEWRKVETDIHKVISNDDEVFTEIHAIADDLGYSYDGHDFDQINEYQLKIVMLSDNTSIVPRVRELRLVSSLP